MGRRIHIFDTTLRDGEQSPGCSLNKKEKIEIAKQLEDLGVDIMEAGFPVASKGDFESVVAIAKEVREATVAGLARAVKGDIDTAWEALKGAASPRIHTFLATSDIHMEYKLKMKPEEVLERAISMVKYARNLCPEIEFSPEDGSRTRPEFLYKVIEGVIDAGARVINIPDTVGYKTPIEMHQLITGIRNNVKNIDKAVISVHCHNDLGLAVANTLAALEAGAGQAECTVNGLGERAGNAALEEIVMAMRTRKDLYQLSNDITTEKIYRTSSLVSYLTGVNIQPNKAIVGANAFAHESGIHQHGVMANRETYEIMTPESIGLNNNKMVLGKHSGRHAFEEKLREMGYAKLEESSINKAFERFKELADKKKIVSDKDIDALLTEEKSRRHKETFTLDHFQVFAGSSITATSTVKIKKNGKSHEEAAVGDGPVDATFKAIDRVCGNKASLEEYFIRAITEGRDALGEVTVKLKKDEKLYVGHGVSTDIIGASAAAYLDAINNIWDHTEEL